MGCEIARQVLDFMGHSQLSAQQLLLKEEDYEGTSLLATAAAARQAVAVARLSDPWMISGAVRQLRSVLNALILPGWVAVVVGLANPELVFLKAAGFFVFGGVFFFGILDFTRDLELQRETLELLKKTAYFEPDEIIKLRRLLGALRLEGLAQIFKVPYEFIAGWNAKRKSHNV